MTALKWDSSRAATAHAPQGDEPSPEAVAHAHPRVLEWAAWLSVIASLLIFGLIRVQAVDVPWHLATARLAFERGQWPIVNSLSWTYPDHPLYQQYPFFQSLLFGVYQISGWEGLSALSCLGWVAAFLLIVRWTGDWKAAASLHLPWMIAAQALQMRMLLRPDMLSMIWLGCMLLVIDAFLRRSRWWILLLPVIQWAWANSHQLFPIGLGVQLVLIVHVLLSRSAPEAQAPGRTRPQSDAHHAKDRRLSSDAIAACAGLCASVLACTLSPLGMRVLAGLSHTAGSLKHHRGQVFEFAYLWQSPLEMQIAIVCGLFALYALWRGRHAWQLLEIGIWLITLILVLAAVRGLAFFGVVSMAMFARVWVRSRGQAARSIPTELRWAMATITLLLAFDVLYHRWINPPLELGGTQPGLGKSLGDWPDHAVKFIRESRLPGNVLNLPWSLGNVIPWELPEYPTFVDGRLEAYPREFLVECMAAARDPVVLARLVEIHAPTWILADHRFLGVRERVAEMIAAGEWKLVYADMQTAVLVRLAPQTRDYIARHELAPAEIQPHDLLEPPALRVQQRVNFALFLDSLGGIEPAEEQLRIAADEARSAPQLVALVSDARARLSTTRPSEAGQ